MKYYDGLLLRIPNKENPDVLEEVVKQEKMLDVFKEYLNWSYIMGLNNAGDFNLACEEGHATDLINVAEALQDNTSLTNDAMVYYLKKYNFTVYDVDIFNALRESNPEYLVQRPDLAEEADDTTATN